MGHRSEGGTATGLGSFGRFARRRHGHLSNCPATVRKILVRKILVRKILVRKILVRKILVRKILVERILVRKILVER